MRSKLKVPIKLNPDRHYKAGLRYFTVYNHVMLTLTRQITSFDIIMVVVGKTVTILPGAYEVNQIDAEIKRLINDKDALSIITRPEINRLGIDIIKERFQVNRHS